MASPLVCVLKGKDGVRLAVNYRYVNKYTIGDAFPVPDFSDIVQRVGQAKYITVVNIKSAYWQTPVREDNQWLGTVENHENTEAVFFVFFVSCRVFRVFLQLPCFAVFFCNFVDLLTVLHSFLIIN